MERPLQPVYLGGLSYFLYDRLCLTFGHPQPGLTSEQLPANASENETAQILAVSKEVLQDLVTKKCFRQRGFGRIPTACFISKERS